MPPPPLHDDTITLALLLTYVIVGFDVFVISYFRRRPLYREALEHLNTAKGWQVIADIEAVDAKGERRLQFLYVITAIRFTTWPFTYPHGGPLSSIIFIAVAMFQVWLFRRSWRREMAHLHRIADYERRADAS